MVDPSRVHKENIALALPGAVLVGLGLAGQTGTGFRWFQLIGGVLLALISVRTAVVLHRGGEVRRLEDGLLWLAWSLVAMGALFLVIGASGGLVDLSAGAGVVIGFLLVALGLGIVAVVRRRRQSRSATTA